MGLRLTRPQAAWPLVASVALAGGLHLSLVNLMSWALAPSPALASPTRSVLVRTIRPDDQAATLHGVEALTPPVDEVEPASATVDPVAVSPDSPASAPTPPMPQRLGPQVEYVPASQLTDRPQPLEDIVVPYPSDIPSGNRVVEVVVTLQLDAQGRVEAVLVEDADTPAAFAAAARAAFAQARFTPGLLNGQPVKTRLRVAVEFQSEEERLELRR